MVSSAEKSLAQKPGAQAYLFLDVELSVANFSLYSEIILCYNFAKERSL